MAQTQPQGAAQGSGPALASNEFDVIVVGAGPGGYVAAIRATHHGLKVGIVEREWMGGQCLNVGCIPSKALLKNADVVRTARDAKRFGVDVGEVHTDYGVGVDRSRTVSEQIVKGVSFLMRKNKIEVINGEGKLTAPNTVEVAGRPYKARHIIIATGSRPRQLPGMEFDGERVVSSWQFILQRERPERIVIIGGGVIGCEIGTVMRAYGSEVTIVEALDRLLPREDERISALLQRSFQRQGYKVITGATVQTARRDGDGVKVVYTAKDGQQQTLEADRCLVAVSIQPNTDNLGLEQVGVQLERGYIKVDHRMATNVPGIWAIGDVTTTPLALAHVASAEGIQAANAIAGMDVRPLNYDNMPRPIFSHPQVASIGLTEAQAKEKGYDVKVGEFPIGVLGKAVALHETEGTVKIVADAKYGEILGCHIIGAEATEVIAQIAPYKVLEGTIHELAEVVVSHPTLGEAVHEAGLVLAGEPIHI